MDWMLESERLIVKVTPALEGESHELVRVVLTGMAVTAQLPDLGDQPVSIGMPVEMVTRKIREDGDEHGMLVYGYKFRPVFR